MNHHLNFISGAILYLGCYLLSVSYGFIYILSLLSENIGGSSIDVGIVLSIAGIVTFCSVWYAGIFAEKIHPAILCAVSAILCACGFLTLANVTNVGYLMYSAGIWIGIGWSYYYACSPMILTHLVSDENRSIYLNRLAAIVVMGTGTSPLLSKYLITTFNIQSIYLIPVIIDILAASCFLAFYFLLKEKSGVSGNRISIKKFIENAISICRSEVKYSLIMVGLGACIFSSMMNFQIIYAQHNMLDYGLYYFSYMLAVIFSRIFISKNFHYSNPIYPTPFLLTLMLLSLILMFFVKQNSLIYIIEAVLIGISYGLVYPLIKTFTVNRTIPKLRQQALSLFTFSYFLGVYIFPAISSIFIQYFSIETWVLLMIMIVIIDIVVAYFATT